jgi:hypothetical protein
VELAAELEASLREFVSAGPVEVRENGGHVAAFVGLSWEVRGAGEKPLLHLWSEQCNLTRRVLAITDHSDERLTLAVERFGHAKPNRLEFLRLDFEPSARALSREEFCERFGRILAQQFPDEDVESLTVSADLEHSLSGNYVRGLLRHGSTRTAVLAAPPGESADAVENSLTFALLWLDHTFRARHHGVISGVRVVVPANATSAVAHRFAALHPKLSIELYALDPARETLERINARSAGNLDAWLVAHRESEALLAQARSAIDPILGLAPNAVTVHPVAQSREVWLRFRGLPFARWDDGRVYFGTCDARQELTAASRPALKRLLRELELHRHPLASDTRHLLYRAQPERWLESLVRADVSQIDALLDPRFAYTQVFANAGGEHGILDVLAVTRSGRLAILELKASEHIHLPLQAADYWLRIRRHLEQGNLAGYGYFPGVELQPTPPLVYLVAPALRFHPSTDILLRYLTPELEIVRVGLSESWRRGIRVVMRQ